MSTFTEQLQHKIDFKTKPLGSLGLIEKIAFKVANIQQTLEPKLTEPHLLVFAGDHGIAQSGVSAYPPGVTFQMVSNIVAGGAAVTVFCKQHGIKVKTIDAGVNYDFENIPQLIDAKINKGTRNFLYEPAMTLDELDQCFEQSKKIVDEVTKTGCNIIGFGEMGIGNTSSASLIMHHICQLPLEDCIGRGTGLNDEQLQNKINILSQANQKHGALSNAKEIMATFGGFEVAQICGAMLQAYRQNMILLIDGFISTAAFLIAKSLEPNIIDNALFCHNSNEVGHQRMLQFLNVEPILNLNLRVGEGTGCALAYPIIQSSVAFLNEMASFDTAGISNKD